MVRLNVITHKKMQENEGTFPMCNIFIEETDKMKDYKKKLISKTYIKVTQDTSILFGYFLIRIYIFFVWKITGSHFLSCFDFAYFLFTYFRFDAFRDTLKGNNFKKGRVSSYRLCGNLEKERIA